MRDVVGDTLPLPQLDALGEALSDAEPVAVEQCEGEPLCDGEDDVEPLSEPLCEPLCVPLAEADGHAEDEGDGEPLEVCEKDALPLSDGDAIAVTHAVCEPL